MHLHIVILYFIIMKPLAIVGIDPGTTCAYGIVDFEGRVLSYYSGKELGLAGVIAAVISQCSPMIVATDKAKVPGFVEEFSRKVGAVICFPDEDLKKEDKRVVVKEYCERKGIVIHTDAHELDSIAAGLIAFNKYKEWLEKARMFLQTNGLVGREFDFFQLALKSELRFGLVKELLMKPSVERMVVREVMVSNKITQKDFKRLYERFLGVLEEKEKVERVLRVTRQELGKVTKENLFLARKPLKFQEKLDQLLLFKEQRLRVQQQEIEKLMTVNRELREKIMGLYTFIGDIGKYVVVKKMNSLGQKEFVQRGQVFDFLERDMVFVGNVNIHSEEVLRCFSQRNISIVTLNAIPENVRRMLNVVRISSEDVVRSNEYFCLIGKECLQRRGVDEGKLFGLISEYQEVRKMGWE